MKYPTKEQILNKDPPIRQFVKEVVLSWKKDLFKDWKNAPNEVKLERLKYLILAISYIAYGNKVIPNVHNGDSYYYKPRLYEIYQDQNNPSIISALHELSHHLNGKSELTACRWSIYIFRTCFPETYKKLKWKGHLLVK